MSSVKPPFKHQWIGLEAEQWSLAISFLSKVAFQGLQGRILIHIDLWAWEFEQAWELQEKSPQSNNFFMISNYIKPSLRTQGVHGSPRPGLSETGANLHVSVKKFQLYFTSVAEICMTCFSLPSQHSYGALLITIQQSRPVNTASSWLPEQFWNENCFPNLLPLAEASGNYRHPACLGTITSHHSTQEPQKNIFHSCQQWQKAPKYCWVTAATDVAHVSISGKATNVCRKHCLKKCQFPSLANSSACFQIQRSSFSSSRDQFDRQILLIPKCYFTLWPSALLFRVLIRIWPWCQ